MRLSTIIAVCLLVLSPRPVRGCIEHDGQPTGWFHETHASAAGLAGDFEASSRRSGLWRFGVGVVSIALVVGSFRAFARAAGRARISAADLRSADSGRSPAERSGLATDADCPMDREGIAGKVEPCRPWMGGARARRRIWSHAVGAVD